LDITLGSLHLPLVLSLIAAAFTLLGGGLREAFATRIGKLMGLFTIWLIVCTAFSDWRGGSFEMLKETWSKSFLVFIIVAGATTSTIQVRRMMIAIGLGSAGAMVLAHVLHGSVEGRLSLPDGYLSNPNDFAQVLLIGLCFFWVLTDAWKSSLTRVVVGAVTLAFLYTIFETGSRGVLLAVIGIAILVFLQASPMRKVILLVAFVVVTSGMFALSPVARNRMATLFSSDDASTLESASSEEMAVASAENRAMLLRESLTLTLRNPLFGVGPGVFESSAAALSREQGRRGLWKQTHNSYTQVSSETGIPGALLFLGAIGYCITGLIRIRKQSRGQPQYGTIHAVATPLLVGFLGFALTSMFSSVAYQFYFSLLIGLCAAAIRAAEKELAMAPSAKPQFSSGRVGPAAGFRQSQGPAPKRLRA
jgi:O-antigen ligase